MSSFDRKNYKSWRGDITVENVDEAACWDHSLNKALCCLRESKIFTDAELCANLRREKEKWVDILKPYNVSIDVFAGDATYIDMFNENNNKDNREDRAVDYGQNNELNRLYYIM